MDLSKFGQKMASDSPIVDLMEDLGEALNQNPDLLFLGGGNPAMVPEAMAIFQRHLCTLANDASVLKSMLGVYQSPQGNEDCIHGLVGYLNKQCSWSISEKNIALVNGSQTAFFILLNLFAGKSSAGLTKKIVLPLVPEYLGYESQGLEREMFQAFRPSIELLSEHEFKYHINFDGLAIDDASAAICVSRPTNPSGNCLSNDEIDQLSVLASENDIPLIIDNAYGQPFPGVTDVPVTPYWDRNTVSVMSLSKLGLPGVRTGIVVADEEIIRLVTRSNTILSLASGNLGPFLLQRLLESGDLARLSNAILPNYYREKRDFMLQCLAKNLKGIPYRIHKPEGAFFVWLWFENLPVESIVLYEQLKRKGVLVMAGEHFFFGLDKSWRHGKECLRLTYCQSHEVIEQAVQIMAKELRALFS